eukprot:TRINITY_DN8342_c0_g1_i1.p1 TRINITY_DN8342_c0_g1~~TRINITY_DN8342_c0_g1_i1.p1  ORF type:complete len:694 (+),score=112.46 TRINITY_DN8342_c0_g1_i1:118-2199(+)
MAGQHRYLQCFYRSFFLSFASAIGALGLYLVDRTTSVAVTPVPWIFMSVPLCGILVLKSVREGDRVSRYREAAVQVMNVCQEVYYYSQLATHQVTNIVSCEMYARILIECLLTNLLINTTGHVSLQLPETLQQDMNWFKASSSKITSLIGLLEYRLLPPLSEKGSHPTLFASLRQHCSLVVACGKENTFPHIVAVRLIIFLFSASLFLPLRYANVARGAAVGICALVSFIWCCLAEYGTVAHWGSRYALSEDMRSMFCEIFVKGGIPNGFISESRQNQHHQAPRVPLQLEGFSLINEAAVSPTSQLSRKSGHQTILGSPPSPTELSPGSSKLFPGSPRRPPGGSPTIPSPQRATSNLQNRKSVPADNSSLSPATSPVADPKRTGIGRGGRHPSPGKRGPLESKVSPAPVAAAAAAESAAEGTKKVSVSMDGYVEVNDANIQTDAIDLNNKTPTAIQTPPALKPDSGDEIELSCMRDGFPSKFVGTWESRAPDPAFKFSIDDFGCFTSSDETGHVTSDGQLILESTSLLFSTTNYSSFASTDTKTRSSCSLMVTIKENGSTESMSIPVYKKILKRVPPPQMASPNDHWFDDDDDEKQQTNGKDSPQLDNKEPAATSPPAQPMSEPQRSIRSTDNSPPRSFISAMLRTDDAIVTPSGIISGAVPVMHSPQGTSLPLSQLLDGTVEANYVHSPDSY